MGTISKSFSLILICILVISSLTLLIVRPASAQSNSVSPVISILSPVNDTTFNIAFGDAPDFSFPLNYTTNMVLSWVGYSIDSGSNVTVSGNSTTVKEPFPDEHNTLTLYANYTSGNWAAPQAVSFVVISKSNVLSTSILSPTLIVAILIVLLIVLFSASIFLNL